MGTYQLSLYQSQLCSIRAVGVIPDSYVCYFNTSTESFVGNWLLFGNQVPSEIGHSNFNNSAGLACDNLVHCAILGILA